MRNLPWLVLPAIIAAIGSAGRAAPAVGRPAPKPVPLMQAVPQAGRQVSFQREGIELARYHYGPEHKRPFVFPLIGPAGRSVTRIGHPHGPQGHSHHLSVWVAHASVNGVSFWEDRGKAGRIVHQVIEPFFDSPDEAAVQTVNGWIDQSGKVVLTDRRRTAVQVLPNDEWLLVVDVQLMAKNEPVTLGKTNFGLLSVRMAKTIGVHDGGGTIRNSAGAVNEREAFGQPAKWVDYSGPITATATNGATLFDHPANPNHPTRYHVRDDGWMGASLTFDQARTIPAGQTLQLRYAVYVHDGMPSMPALQRQWEAFARKPMHDFKPAR